MEHEPMENTLRICVCVNRNAKRLDYMRQTQSNAVRVCTAPCQLRNKSQYVDFTVAVRARVIFFVTILHKQ